MVPTDFLPILVVLMALLAVYAFYEYFKGNKNSKEEQLLEESENNVSNQVLVSDEQASECERIEKKFLKKHQTSKKSLLK